MGFGACAKAALLTQQMNSLKKTFHNSSENNIVSIHLMKFPTWTMENHTSLASLCYGEAGPT